MRDVVQMCFVDFSSQIESIIYSLPDRSALSDVILVKKRKQE